MEFLNDITVMTIIQVGFWLFAAVASLYFSIGNARVWTSISTGFFLIFFSQAYLLNPYAMYHKLAAIHYIISTIAIIVLTFGFREYFFFARTLEIGGSKRMVYLITLLAVAASAAFILVNPKPEDTVLRNIKMIDNTNWVFLSLVNILMIRKIYVQIKDSPISRGFIAFGVVFFCIFLWKGSALYLQVYQWDNEWRDIISFLGGTTDAANYPGRIVFSLTVNRVMAIASPLSVGGTFLYLLKLLR